MAKKKSAAKPKAKPYLLAWEDYKTGAFTYEQIAKKYKVTLSAVRSWQNRYWRDLQNSADDSQNTQDGAENMQSDLQNDIHSAIADRAKHPNIVKGQPVAKGVTLLQGPTEIIPRIVAKQLAETRPDVLIDALDTDYSKLLEPRQLRLIEEYLIDYNATAAAIRAGYPPHNACRVASAIMQLPHVSNCLAQAEALRSSRTGLNAELVDLEIGRLMRINPTNVIDLKTGKVRDDASPDDLAAIQSVKVKSTPSKLGIITEYEVRLVPKEKMIELAARRQGLLIDRKQVENHTIYETAAERQARIRELQKELEQDTYDTTATVIRDDNEAE